MFIFVDVNRVLKKHISSKIIRKRRINWMLRKLTVKAVCPDQRFQYLFKWLASNNHGVRLLNRTKWLCSNIKYDKCIQDHSGTVVRERSNIRW